MMTRLPLSLFIAASFLFTACSPDQAQLTSADLPPLQARMGTVEIVLDSTSVEVRGTVHAQRQAKVSSRVMGPVIAVRVQPGDKVERNQVLVEIFPETSQAQVRQAEGALAQAQAALTLAARNLTRFEALAATKSAAEVELDMARMQQEQATGAVTQAEGAVKAAQSVAQEALVRAPFRARVVHRWVEVGDLAAPGRPLVTLESDDSRALWLTVSEVHIQKVALGQELSLEIDARSDLGSLLGTVSQIVPTADPSTHTFTVKVDLGRSDIATGLTGRARLQGLPRERLTVAQSAVHHRGGLELVVVRAADGTARTRAVTTGATAGVGRIEVLSGLSAGDSVVINASAPVADGTPLEIGS